MLTAAVSTNYSNVCIRCCAPKKLLFSSYFCDPCDRGVEPFQDWYTYFFLAVRNPWISQVLSDTRQIIHVECMFMTQILYLKPHMIV